MPDRIRLLFLVDSIPAPAAPRGLLFDPLSLDLDQRVFSVEVAVIRPHDAAAESWTAATPTHSLNLMPGSWRHGLFSRLSIRRLLSRHRPDCICALGATARRLGLPTARTLGIPLRLAIVDTLGEELTPALVTALRAADRHATHFIADSYTAVRRLMRQERISRNMIDILPPGVDCSRFPDRTTESVIDAKHRLGLSRQQPVIVMAAPFGRRQNHRMFLEAAAQLIRHQSLARFVLIGTGTHDEMSDVRRAIQHLHLSNHVQLFGSFDLLPAWLQAADVGVSTSYLDSASRSLLLYMAAGLPIVAVKAGGNGELIAHGESGYLAGLTDVDQLAMYVMVLLLSPEQSARFGAAARHRAETEFALTRARCAYEDYFRTMAYAILVR